MAWYAAAAWQGRDVLTERPSRITPLDEKERLRRWTVDTESGVLSSRRVWNNPSRAAAFTFQLRARSELADLRSLAAHLAGRWRGIWVPSWHHDLALASDVGINASTWLIRSVGFESRYLPDESRRHLVLSQPSGALIYRKVLAATDNLDGTETLDVRFDQHGTANGSVIPAGLATVSLLRWMRLDVDSIEITRHAHEYYTVQLPLVELPDDVPSA